MHKIIQTFWNSQKGENPLLNTGGFLCPEIHWMSWAFSCLQLKKFYPQVELHTDFDSKKVFELLELPYTKIHTSLETDFMQNLHPAMWSYAKMHTYSLQNEPFLHVDGDVFIWKSFEDKLLEGELIAQNVEKNLLQIYKHGTNTIRDHASYVPDWITNNSNVFSAYNAGIIGGTDTDFFKEYTSLAFDFYDKNENVLDKLKNIDANINTIPEQYLFYVLSKKKNIKVNCYSDREVCIDADFGEFVNVNTIPNRKQYLHLLGQLKQNRNSNDFVNYILKKEYPDYWNKILNLYKERNILSSYFKRYLNIKENKSIYIPAQFELDENVKYKMLKQQCKVLDVDFTGFESISHNSKLVEMYNLVEQEYEIGKINNLKPNLNLKPFPLYASTPSIFNDEKELLDSYVLLNENHFIKKSRYDWSNIQGQQDVKFKDLNPYKSYNLYCITPDFYSLNQIVLTDILVMLLEKIKENPIKVKDLLKISNLMNSTDNKTLFRLLEDWHSSGLVYFSKSKKDFIPQKPSEVYVKHQHNLNTQISTCFKRVLNNYQITDYKEKLITQFDFSKKNISLHDIIKVFEKLNFETKGVRGDLESLQQIPLPAVALVKLREYVSLYVLITKVTETHITIFNTELNEEEDYQLSYFTTIWDGILILMLPKTK